MELMEWKERERGKEVTLMDEQRQLNRSGVE